MPILQVRTPGHPPLEVEIASEMTFGRAENCEIVIDEQDISRRHAVLRRRGGTFVIEDLGSRNGVFVNDEQVQEAEIAPGDVVRLGRSVELEILASRERYVRGKEAPPPRSKPRGAGFSPFGWLMRTDDGLAALDRRHGFTPITGSSTIVGRDKSSGLAIDDESVSRVHARIDRDAEGLMVTDLKSRNGVLVNGEAMMQAPLEPGDEVQFGDVAFTVERRTRLDPARLGLALFGVVAVVGMVFGLMALGRWSAEREAMNEERIRVRRQAMASLENGIQAWDRGEADIARGYLLNASDFIQLGGLAPKGASLERPAELFRPLLKDLPEEQRDFDFRAALDPGSTANANARAQLATMSDSAFIAHETRRIASEMGQDSEVPAAFVGEVTDYVRLFNERDRGSFQKWLDRSRVLQPRLRSILADAHLPEVFCYVAWVESGLNPTATSGVGARGLWQFMVPTARQYGLVVDPGRGIDERTDPAKSTEAAGKHFGFLLRRFGSEQMMCAIASYNVGHGAVQNAMNKIPDPLYPSSKRYWYMVEHNLLPDETSQYVPKIFAVAILASSPERFGFQRP